MLSFAQLVVSVLSTFWLLHPQPPEPSAQCPWEVCLASLGLGPCPPPGAFASRKHSLLRGLLDQTVALLGKGLGQPGVRSPHAERAAWQAAGAPRASVENYMNKFITTCLMTRSFGRRFQQTHVNHTDHAMLSRLNSLQSFPPLRLGPKLLIAVMGPHSSLTLPSTLATLSLLLPQQPLSPPWKHLFDSPLYSPH